MCFCALLLGAHRLKIMSSWRIYPLPALSLQTVVVVVVFMSMTSDFVVVKSRT